MLFGITATQHFVAILADPQEISKHRFILAQKYGYELPDLEKDPSYEMLKERKGSTSGFLWTSTGLGCELKR
ncbi:hypothetical protein MRX96_000519 [Rhipicephalus microplus]